MSIFIKTTFLEVKQFFAATYTASDKSIPMIRSGGGEDILFTMLIYLPFPQPASITILFIKKFGIDLV
jgi:hypothetical protein